MVRVLCRVFNFNVRAVANLVSGSKRRVLACFCVLFCFWIMTPLLGPAQEEGGVGWGGVGWRKRIGPAMTTGRVPARGVGRVGGEKQGGPRLLLGSLWRCCSQDLGDKGGEVLRCPHQNVTWGWGGKWVSGRFIGITSPSSAPTVTPLAVCFLAVLVHLSPEDALLPCGYRKFAQAEPSAGATTTTTTTPRGHPHHEHRCHHRHPPRHAVSVFICSHAPLEGNLDKGRKRTWFSALARASHTVSPFKVILISLIKEQMCALK